MPVQHTMVPYMWRRHLGIIRALLGSLCVVVYLLYPVRYSLIVATIAALYATYSLLSLVRDSVESNLYPLSTLLLDLTFFPDLLTPSERAGTVAQHSHVLLRARLLGAALRMVARVRNCRLLHPLLHCHAASTCRMALAGGRAGGSSGRSSRASQKFVSGPIVGGAAQISHLPIGSGNRAGIRTPAHRGRFS